VVDDSIVVRQVLVLTLRQMPVFAEAEIDEAGNGAVALHKLEHSRYDLVLSDIRMPLLDGLALVRRMRESPRDRDTPVVLVSTLGTEEDVRRGMDAGATAYILKPLSPHHIKAALRQLLEAGPLRGLAAARR
jgi:two-component system chemotaxis response regulator CheY